MAWHFRLGLTGLGCPMKLLNLREDHLLKRYKSKDKKVILELQLANGQQLFDARDPSPLRGRDLNEHVVKYIIESFQEIPKDKDVSLTIYFSEGLGIRFTEGQIKRAIQTFFEDEMKTQSLHLKQVLTHGFKSLIIGLSFLFFCVFTYYYFKNLPETLFNNFFKETTHVLGWVSMWHPINIFLYEWWPIIEKKNLLKRISVTEVNIVSRRSQVQTMDNII